MNIAITGANGSAGSILLRHLADEDDIHVVACVRSARAAASPAASPRISPRVIDYNDRKGLASALMGAGCVVHLAGILLESASSNYETANVDATRAVVEACKAAGVRHIVLVSALGADPGSNNGYLRSKGRAERIVADSGSRRPSFARRSCWALERPGPVPSSTQRHGRRSRFSAAGVTRFDPWMWTT